MRNCPVCRQPHAAGQDVIMERLLEHIVFPCKFKENGCTFRDYARNLPDHEKTCILDYKTCPARRFMYCTWVGPYHMVVDHCRDVHSDCFYEGPCVSYYWRDFRNIDSAKSANFLIHCFDALFCCKFIAKDRTWSTYVRGLKFGDVKGCSFTVEFLGHYAGVPTFAEVTYCAERSNSEYLVFVPLMYRAYPKYFVGKGLQVRITIYMKNELD